jgi:hypothetical protein
MSKSAQRHQLAAPLSTWPGGPVLGLLQDIQQDGQLIVEWPDGRLRACDWLISPLAFACPQSALAAGDTVLVMDVDGEQGRPVVMGKVGAYAPPAQLTLQAPDALSLKCGQAGVELRADGRVLIKGEDVTVHAKGTQRIRAGTVAIN